MDAGRQPPGRLFPERVRLGRAFRWAPRHHRRQYNYPGNYQLQLTNLGAIYDLAKNTWTPLGHPRGWKFIGDSESSVLPDGRFLVGQKLTEQDGAMNPTTLNWTKLGHTGKSELQLRGGLDSAAGRHDPHRRREKRPQTPNATTQQRDIGPAPVRRSSICIHRRPTTSVCSTARSPKTATCRRVRSGRQS